ncbi:hypothetical protein BGZ96_003841 [Linnemannia gamsii]|uniref:Uncharacterized protein n=1 Tax=Linnemannia gamsii TaxID=64522 RepID=A0ABQ7K7C5_9FUNG|nr:hypothetical protein BGZ96_003841 [Linnemannia gamsii]
MDHEIIYEKFVVPSMKSAQTAKAKPPVLQSIPDNRPNPHYQQDQAEDKQRTFTREEEVKDVNWNMFKSGRPPLDHEHRRANNRSACNSPTPSSSSRFYHCDQNRQPWKPMERHKYARFSAGEKVTNRSQALDTSVSQLKQGKAIWRRDRHGARKFQGAIDDYDSLKHLYSCAGQEVKDSFDQQNHIRQAKRLTKRHG